LVFVYLLIWEGTWGWSFDDFLPLATSSAENHSVFVFLAQALTVSKTFRLTYKSTSYFILVLDEMAGLFVFK
jgi:hypothetical protein